MSFTSESVADVTLADTRGYVEDDMEDNITLVVLLAMLVVVFEPSKLSVQLLTRPSSLPSMVPAKEVPPLASLAVKLEVSPSAPLEVPWFGEVEVSPLVEVLPLLEPPSNEPASDVPIMPVEGVEGEFNATIDLWL